MRGDFSCCLVSRGGVKTEPGLTGMRTHVVGYLDTTTGLHTFTVHFYMDDAGTIGASGLPDPKWLYEDGVIYTCNRRGRPDDPR